MIFDRTYFDRGLERMGTRSEKWDTCRREHGTDVLPMWVADMDFPSPPACAEAILKRAAHPTYCYTEICPDDFEAVAAFWKRRHGLTVDPGKIVMLPCVVTGLKTAIRALTVPGDGVIILSPVYGPFRFSVEATGRRLMDVPLVKDEMNRYFMDLAGVESALKDGGKLIMLCNPHNPVGRCWTREELTALLALLDRYDAYLVSDEIHADFVYDKGAFTPALALREDRVLSLCAASKTFNLAGLQQASALCPDDGIREKYTRALEEAGVTSGNIFALEATRAAYTDGDAWLDGLIAYLDENRRYLTEWIGRELPRVKVSPLEATYLAWLDCTAYTGSCEEIAGRCEKAGLVMTGGDFFGKGGDGFMRLNFACPRSTLEEGLQRLKTALEG
ncbi:MAG: PatB family C-S lyase [Clostridia bacterium]|nr:PatB family C-S lyase [Clostridia bacterium]